jgi:hypothetical protein
MLISRAVTLFSRLMSRKQRCQQVQPAPSAPADAQLWGSGEGSHRTDKSACEDDVVGGGDSDESGAVFWLIFHIDHMMRSIVFARSN